MLFRLARIAAATCLLTAICLACHALPVVDMPTANMQSPMSIAIDYYSLEIRHANPSRMNIVAGYIGLAERLELDVIYMRLKGVPHDISAALQYLVASERGWRPAVAFGVEDAGLELGDRSIYAVASKTVTRVTDDGPVYPWVQCTLGYGTAPRSAVFGGVLIGLHPLVSVAAQNNGRLPTYVISVTIPKTTLCIRYGNLGNAKLWGMDLVLPL